ncbi:MAG: hypothetical protein JWL69_593, partial [Phycisphaerales bacterium]|nr:hypothetical protein [Phycisphaerales bacterium]
MARIGIQMLSGAIWPQSTQRVIPKICPQRGQVAPVWNVSNCAPQPQAQRGPIGGCLPQKGQIASRRSGAEVILSIARAAWMPV